jgi:hypothetical protein
MRSTARVVYAKTSEEGWREGGWEAKEYDIQDPKSGIMRSTARVVYAKTARVVYAKTSEEGLGEGGWEAKNMTSKIQNLESCKTQ